MDPSLFNLFHYSPRLTGVLPQNLILNKIEASLLHELLVETRHRKPLRPNDLSAWELRVGNFRVFYDVNEEKKIVLIKVVGYKKHNALYIRGRRFEL